MMLLYLFNCPSWVVTYMAMHPASGLGDRRNNRVKMRQSPSVIWHHAPLLGVLTHGRSCGSVLVIPWRHFLSGLPFIVVAAIASLVALISIPSIALSSFLHIGQALHCFLLRPPDASIIRSVVRYRVGSVYVNCLPTTFGVVGYHKLSSCCQLGYLLVL